jgi:hypothetical protein
VLDLGLSIPAVAACRQSRNFDPTWLGTDLKAWFDAEVSANITQSAGKVSSWACSTSGCVVSQATGAFQPSISATGFKGTRPGVVFDGVGDILLAANAPASFPVGSDPSEMWVLAENTDAASSIERTAFHIGTPGGSGRSIRAGSTGGFGIAYAGNGGGFNAATTPNGTAVGVHVLRARFTASSTFLSSDNGSEASVANALNTNGVWVGIGNLQNASTLCWQGGINTVILTGPLDSTKAGLLMAYLKSRGGIA